MVFLTSVLVGIAISVVTPPAPAVGETVGIATGVVKVVRDSHGKDWGGVQLKNGGGIIIGSIIGRELRDGFAHHRAPAAAPEVPREVLPGDRMLHNVYGGKMPVR